MKPSSTRIHFLSIPLVALLGLATPLTGSSDPSSDELRTVILELSEQADLRSVDRDLKLQQSTRTVRHQQVLATLRRAAEEQQPPVLGAIAELEAQGEVVAFTRYWIANLIRVTGTEKGIEILASLPEIRHVYPEERIRLIRPVQSSPAVRTSKPGEDNWTAAVASNLTAIRAPEVWDSLGVTGQGALVGILDTGVDGTHPALSASWRGNNGHPWPSCWFDVQGFQTTYPNDPIDHGTHVAGTAVGLDPAGGDTVGVAWGAQWIAANGVGDDPSSYGPDMIACFQWFLDPDGDPQTIEDVPDVIGNSWGISESYGYPDCTDLWNLVIDNCEAAGTVVLFAAGNWGPSPSSIDSPADRATSQYNCFSVGAVNSFDLGWPYPVTDFSSRGPSTCTTVPGLEIKPEICAPGFRVYSSVPGGGYQEMGGTSMAVPHVAGVVALMRSANPDIEVDAIKQILLDTARDAGASGEDNDYGWGVLDAFAAVEACLGAGYGSTAGMVTNADGGGSPVPYARVGIVETGNAFTTDPGGQFWGLLAPGTYTLEVTHPSFSTVTRPGVLIVADQLRTEDFALEDNAPPELTEVAQPPWIETPTDPISIRVTINDLSPLSFKNLVWRANVGPWQTASLDTISENRYLGNIPGQPLNATIHYYLEAGDVAGHSATSPAGAPGQYHSLQVLPVYFGEDAEADNGWSLSQPGDATEGLWVRQDPFGTFLQGTPVEPTDDHTPDPGVACFVTGAGFPGAEPDQSDVDGGCVTLTSPLIDLQSVNQPSLSYWRWFTLKGLYQFGSFEALVSNDDGQSWTTLELISVNQNAWTQSAFELWNILPLTAQMRFRFTVCDYAQPTLVEGALDDVLVSWFPPVATVGEEAVLRPILGPGRPNPFASTTQFDLWMPRRGSAALTIHDISGRRIRTLVLDSLEAGHQILEWNGRDDRGQRVAPGMYFVNLRGPGVSASQKLALIK